MDALVVPSVEEVRAMSAAEVEHAVQQLDAVRREAESATALLLAHVEEAGAFRSDRHRNPRAFGMAACNWSYADAGLLVQCAHVLQVWPSAFGLGVSQLHTLARLVANPRVRHALADAEARLVGAAQSMDFHEFKTQDDCREHRQDQDGSEASLERAHRERDAKCAVVGDVTYVDAKCGNTQGAFVKEVLAAFTHSEFLADWEQGAAQHGEGMHKGLLVRTEAQRRFDGFFAMVHAAANALPGAAGEGGVPTVNLVSDLATFEHELVRFAGGDPAPLDPDVAHFCRTDSGVPIDRRDMVIAALMGHVRRVVIDSQGVVVNLGRRQRLFTGPVREAILALQPTCYCGGCRQRSREVDHLQPWSQGGRTDARNGGGACGYHNRLKSRGYATCRGPDGEWHHYRPDGTEIGWRNGYLTRLRPPPPARAA